MKFIGQIMHFRIAWSLQLLFIDASGTQVTFFYNSNKFGHSLHGETFLIVDEVFFFKSA